MDQNTPQQSEPSSAKAPLLPLWATVEEAYRTVWGYRVECLKIIWCWMLLAIPVMCLYSWFAWPFMKTSICWDFAHLTDKASMDTESNKMLMASLPESLFILFFGASIAVAWHRLILRHEKVTGTHYLRLDSVVWDYFSFGFCIWLPMQMAVFLPSGWPISTLLLIAPCIVLFTRISIILPARALERKDITLNAVWQNTGWNFWRLFWGGLLCSLPSIPFAFIVKSGCDSNIAGPIMHAIGMLVSTFIVLPLELAFLSLSYQHFFEIEKKAILPTSKLPVKTIVSALFIFIVYMLVHTATDFKDALIANENTRTKQSNGDTENRRYAVTSKADVDFLRKAAIQGDAKAQLALGWVYYNGEVVEKDPKEAMNWWRKAADQGDAEAQAILKLQAK